MEKIQIKNGLRIREINVYIQAQDSKNPLFQCWLILEQDVDRDTLMSAKIKYRYGENEYCINTDYNLEFFDNLLDKQLRKPGDMLHGDCNSYAAAVTEYITGVILEDGMICNGTYTVIRSSK